MTTSSISMPPRATDLAVRIVSLRTAVLALTLIGFGLRLAAARGDLWLDEIWTFRLLEEAPSFWSIFFGLPNDNNHLLNTAWMALVGPDASPMLVRLPSVIFGALSIPVAARIGARRGPPAALLGSAAVAFGMIFVAYGSEARGYSGMILAMLVATDATETYLDDTSRQRPLLVVALAVAFGTLSQFTMIATSLTLGLTVAIRCVMRDGFARVAFRPIERFAGAILRGSLPALICVAVSVLRATPHSGVQWPFTWPGFAIGMARAFEATLGLPDSQNLTVSTVVLVGTFAVAVIGLALVPRERRVLPAVAIFGVPVLHVLMHVPNEQFARFHLVSSLGLLILAMDVTLVAARAQKSGRQLVAVGLALSGAGQAYNLTRLIHEGRGSFHEPVAIIGTREPRTVFVRPDIRPETLAVANWYAAKRGFRIERAASPCAGAARWLLAVQEPGALATAPRQNVPGDGGCVGRFAFRAAYPAYGLSGFTWVLYEHEDAKRP